RVPTCDGDIGIVLAGIDLSLADAGPVTEFFDGAAPHEAARGTGHMMTSNQASFDGAAPHEAAQDEALKGDSRTTRFDGAAPHEAARALFVHQYQELTVSMGPRHTRQRGVPLRERLWTPQFRWGRATRGSAG